MINLDHIFSLFSKGEKENKENTYVDFLHSPHYVLSMYIRLVLKQKSLFKSLISTLPSPNVLNLNDIEQAGRFFCFARAWDYISGVDIKNSEHVEAIKKFDKELLNIAINKHLKFLISEEEYEKCSFLKEIQSFLT